MNTPLQNTTALWHELNEAVGDAAGNGHPADPYRYASLLDSRASCWLELGRLHDAGEQPQARTDVYTVACHYASILDQQDAARVRFAHSIPTLRPGALLANLRLEGQRCTACGRPWQIDVDGACEKCPRLLRGVSPAHADEVGKFPPGQPWSPWAPGDDIDEDDES